MAKKKEEKISDALLKVALGCKTQEVTEEYAQVDGEWKLTKRKKTEKDIPPDLKAVQMLLEKTPELNVESMSDEELCLERQRLIGELLKAEQKKTEKEEKQKEDGKAKRKSGNQKSKLSHKKGGKSK